MKEQIARREIIGPENAGQVCLFVVKGHRPLTYQSITKIYKQ